MPDGKVRAVCISTIATRVFNTGDQDRFASLSGDINPMHVDPIAARRTQAGAPIVHGMHAALWALDTLIGAGRVTAPVATLKVQFQKFIYVGAQVTLSLMRQSGTALRANLAVEDLTVATFAIGFGLPAADDAVLISTQAVSTAAPAILDLPDLPGHTGWLPGTVDRPLARLFQHASEQLGSVRVEALARLSTLVGMVCPGMHSIFGDLNVRVVGAGGANGLSFGVRGVDERFRRAEIAVGGGGITGTVTAFVRQPPVEQRTIRELSGLVAADEFRATTALIVGGSRGLGALTARVLIAGGGRVVITYAVGEIEAREIAAEVGSDACRVLRYDAREDAPRQLAGLEWEVNQLYYFATTQIFRQKASLYVPRRFAEFSQIYVDGFHAVCAALHARGVASLSVFYPSSVAVQDHPRDMTEYSMAKAAGELLCADMNRFLRGTRVVVSRLPRMLTDQTATVTPVQSDDPLEVMLPIIRDMHAGADIESGVPETGGGTGGNLDE